MEAEVINQPRIGDEISCDSPIIIELILENQKDITHLYRQVGNGSIELWNTLKELMKERSISGW